MRELRFPKKDLDSLLVELDLALEHKDLNYVGKNESGITEPEASSKA